MEDRIDVIKLTFAFTTILLFAAAGFAQNRPIEIPLEKLSVNQMMRSHLNAGTRIPDEEAPGGFATSGNYPRDIPSGSDFESNAISLVVRPDEEAIYDEKYKGTKLLLINTTGKEEWFPALDSRLYIIQEAIDKDGKWKPIEAFPTSWCGNSYHRVRLGSKEYWEFSAPLYHGSFKTKLRFRLGQDERSAVYSNEFEGSVNRGQFTNVPKSRWE